MRRATTIIGVLAVFVGLLLIDACRQAPSLGAPLNGLTREQREQFDKGRVEFERVFTPETGLGPLFNANACAECHEDPVTGGVGDEAELHVAILRAGNVCDPLVQKGGPVFQQQVTPALKAILGIDSEPVPPETTARATRTTPDIFGFGLLDAVPDAAILANADPDDRNHDGISGRPNRFFDGRLGRFGRKAFLPNLREFNAGAFVIEQGITNPLSPDEGTVGGNPIPPGADPVPEPEISQQAVDAADAFVRFLAPPAPLKFTEAAKRGRKIFSNIGCAKCHLPKLKTGDHPVAALRNKTVAAYTDLLLHDMGPDLADICLGLATPSEFRTEPLMGLRLAKVFLHDGRASSIEEAIRLHGGEGAGSRDNFQKLSDADRQALLDFLKSL